MLLRTEHKLVITQVGRKSSLWREVLLMTLGFSSWDGSDCRTEHRGSAEAMTGAAFSIFFPHRSHMNSAFWWLDQYSRQIPWVMTLQGDLQIAKQINY